MKQSQTALTPEVLEFATVAVPFCTLLHDAAQMAPAELTDKLLRILPLLYIKTLPLLQSGGDDAALFDKEEEYFLPEYVSETEYTLVERGLEQQFGRGDLFLEALSPEMQYSDRPLTARLSETLTDIYQPIGNFVGLLRDEVFDLKLSTSFLSNLAPIGAIASWLPYVPCITSSLPRVLSPTKRPH